MSGAMETEDRFDRRTIQRERKEAMNFFCRWAFTILALMLACLFVGTVLVGEHHRGKTHLTTVQGK